MANCLKTQLTAVVNNSNIVELGHFRLVKKTEAGVGSLTIKPRNNQPSIFIKSINNESVDIESYYGIDDSVFSVIRNAPLGTIIDISNKYIIGSVTMSSGAFEIPTEMFKYAPITFYSVPDNGEDFSGDIADMVYSTDRLSAFIIRRNNVYGNISCLIGKLTSFSANSEMNLSYNANLEGILSSDFLPFSGRTITITGTKITTTQAVIDAFVAKGKTINCSQNQIVG